MKKINQEPIASSAVKLQEQANVYGKVGTLGSIASIGAALLLATAVPGVGTVVGLGGAGVAAWMLKKKLDKESAASALKAGAGESVDGGRGGVAMRVPEPADARAAEVEM